MDYVPVEEALGLERSLKPASTERNRMSTYAVVNPATGETIKEYPEIGDDELRAAIERADEASRTWPSSSTVAERAALVRKVGELHSERRQQLAEIIVREMGKPIEQALMEVDFAGEIYGFYADNAESLMADEPIELLDGEGTAVVRRSPFGVLLGIMPWNFPYYQVARFAGPNLVIGNTILLKHAPQCPESAEAMQQMFDDAGFPEGAYENIYASNEQIEWVIADPRVHGVSVTGSERAGAAVAEIAGRNLKKVVLEIGGSDPFILLGTDDLDGAARGGGRSAARQHRPVLQRGQALHRRRRALRRLRREVPREVRRGEAGRPDRRGHRGRPALLGGGGRPARGPGQAGDRQRRRGRRRRQARRQLLRTDDPHRDRARRRGLPGRVLRPGRAGLPGRLRGRGGRRSPTRPRSGSAPT